MTALIALSATELFSTELLPAAMLASDSVADGALIVSMFIAFLAGVLSFLSPCVLPLVPVYLSYVTGLSAADLQGQAPRSVGNAPNNRRVSHTSVTAARTAATGYVDDADADADKADAQVSAVATAHDQPTQEVTPVDEVSRGTVRRRVIVGSLGFVLGTAVVFVSFGTLFGSFGALLRTHAVGLSQIFGVVTIVLGLLFAGAFERFNFLQRDVRIRSTPGRGLFAAPILGFTFALGWTPCIGPTLGAVLGMSASTDGATAFRGALLSIAYCIGLGLPLLIAGLTFTRAMTTFSFIQRHYRSFMIAGGVGLIILGILQVTGLWIMITDALQRSFGGWALPL